MHTLLGWSVTLCAWSLVPVVLTQWPPIDYSLVRTIYVATWATWGWLPVTMAYATLRSVGALHGIVKQTVDTTLPAWCTTAVESSTHTLLRYLDQRTFSVVQRQLQAETLVDLWLPRAEQAFAWLNQPDIRAIAEQWLPPDWWLHLQHRLDQGFPAESIASIRRATESWLVQLEVAFTQIQHKETQPLARWLDEQLQQFLVALYAQYVLPWARSARLGYRFWLGLLALWALLPWVGWWIVATFT